MKHNTIDFFDILASTEFQVQPTFIRNIFK